ncbi:sugar transferase [Adlercreutzia sp. ZJ242]|uniref:sugar transferase n=1 Tax=Adlercreutzia sp. ZJ242 TaxID=2709409 RepID=UPI001F154226|nr:sugar transferase [Adlercreutzia sp. ZJ242]
MELYGGEMALGDQAEEACVGTPGLGASREAALDGKTLTGVEDRIAYRAVKRAFDIAFSLFVLVAFCWLYAIIAVAIKLDDPSGPVIFRQKRVTRDGREFTMYKFRSMCVDAEERLEELRKSNEKTGPVFKMADDPRVTRAGKWLRKLSLDELPQFVNVLKGDISIVGPRPALPSEVATYDDYQRQRLLVKAGITCYWQTRRNRDAITFDEWVDLDLLYIEKCGLWADFKLIVQTVGVVLTAQGS